MDYGHPPQPVMPSVPPSFPPEPSANQARGSRWKWAVALLGLLIITVGILQLQQKGDNRLLASLGFSDRKPLTVEGLDQVVELQGRCFTAYQLQAGGRNDQSQQTYLVTINLKSSPASEEELMATLAASDCETELKAILTAIELKKVIPTNQDVLGISYRGNSGQRFLVP